MSPAESLSRASRWPAYALCGLAMLLWVGCALPAGSAEGLVGGSLANDAGTPLFRQAWILVPALFLLVLTPAAMTLATGRQGRLAILAATDAFLTLYAALVLTFRPDLSTALRPRGPLAVGLLVGLYVLAGLSVVETRRLVLGRLGPPRGGWGGARLALCLLVLLIPAGPLLAHGQERASLLAPFLFVALSAGGARLARTSDGLAFTAALLHVALAAHVLVTLRYTILHETPHISPVGLVGRATLDLGWALLAIALLRVPIHVARALRREAVEVAA